MSFGIEDIRYLAHLGDMSGATSEKIIALIESLQKERDEYKKAYTRLRKALVTIKAGYVEGGISDIREFAREALDEER